jgi:hypothetical protein
LTPPGRWRLLRQLVATLYQAIAPQPSLTAIAAAHHRLRRHLCEPSRKKRTYQSILVLF